MLNRIGTRITPASRRAICHLGKIRRTCDIFGGSQRQFSSGGLKEKLVKIGAQQVKHDIVSMSPSFAVIEKLNLYVKANPHFGDKLVQSLQMAKAQAEPVLDAALFNALEWPTTFPEYEQFLFNYSRWIPQQSSLPAWAKPDGTSQEIYDRLSHFYFLIDQPVMGHGKVPQNDPFFSEWLVEFAAAWGTFLNTTESFSDDILQTYILNSPQFRIKDSMLEENGVYRPNNPSGWLTFNQFFARTINPGLRPIASPQDNTVLSSPADFNFRQKFKITSDSTIVDTRFKKTHTVGSIEELLDGSPYGNAFANGTFIHYYLSTFSYHRFHAPVNGKLVDCKAVRGKTYLDVNLLNGQFDMPDGTETGYEFHQARGVVTYDTSGSPCGDVGIVGVVPIGMCQVSSVNMTATPGLQYAKGDEFGYFMFGGSDMILLFQDGVEKDLDMSDNYHLHGENIGSLNGR